MALVTAGRAKRKKQVDHGNQEVFPAASQPGLPTVVSEMG